jgi:hypothetical protein
MRPGKRDALDRLSTASLRDGLEHRLRLKIVQVEGDNQHLGFEIPDLDILLSGGTQPVSHRGEAESIDGSESREGGKMTTFGQIPEHGSTVLATRSTQRTVRGHGNSVDVALVADEVSSELDPLRESPHFDELVPSSRYDKGGGAGGGEADTGHPVAVSFLRTLLALIGNLDSVLAYTKGVPKLDGTVARTRHDLTIVRGEGDGKNIFLVTNEALHGVTRLEGPQTKSSIPRSREGELPIRGDGDVRDEVGMTGETTLGLANDVDGTIGGGVVIRQVPHNDRLVTRGRDEKIRGIRGSRGRDSGHPVGVSGELSAKDNVGVRGGHVYAKRR